MKIPIDQSVLSFKRDVKELILDSDTTLMFMVTNPDIA